MAPMMMESAERESLREVVALFERMVEKVRESGLDREPRFRAYMTCHLEGEDGGWMGGPFLRDELLRTLNEAEDEMDAEYYGDDG